MMRGLIQFNSRAVNDLTRLPPTECRPYESGANIISYHNFRCSYREVLKHNKQQTANPYIFTQLFLVL